MRLRRTASTSIIVVAHLDLRADVRAVAIAPLAGQEDSAAIISRVMDTMRKTAAVIIEIIETRLIGNRAGSEDTEESVSLIVLLIDTRR